MRGEEEEEECHRGVLEVRRWSGCGALETKKELFVVAAALGLWGLGGQCQGLVEGIGGEEGG